MKKICIFCETWESGGIESFIFNVLTRINLKDLEVDIVVSKLKSSMFTESLLAHGIKVCELSGSTRNIVSNCILFKKFLMKRQYDVVYFNIFHALSLLYIYLAKQSGVKKCIAHAHNNNLRKSFFKPIKWRIHCCSRWLFSKYATDFWACSHSAALFMFDNKALERIGWTFIPNGIDINRFCFSFALRADMRKKLNILDDEILIGNVGRLCAQKNQIFALDVFKSCLEINPKCKLILVGEGEDKYKIEAYAFKLGVNDKLIIGGVIPNVESVMSAMDVFLFPSFFEGFGIVALEAQASGLPVICSDRVPDEVKLLKTCITLNLEQDIALWAKTVLLAAENNTSRTVEDLILSNFSIDKVANEILDRWQIC